MEEPSAWQNFFEILSKPDNIPIAGLLLLVIFFSWIGLKQALRNDKLLEKGDKDALLKDMWK